MKTIFLHGFSGDRSSLAVFVEACNYERSYAIDLPGFGANKRQYELTWDGYEAVALQTIYAAAGAGPYRLIGHSHGAMVAYGLAITYPSEVQEVVLICPVASGSNLGRVFMKTNSMLRRVFGDRIALGILTSVPMVDAVTRISKRPDWPRAAYERLIMLRRQESTRYDAAMLDVLKLIPLFRNRYTHTRLKMPSTILFAHNDVLVSSTDRDWYKCHTTSPRIEWCRGGHVAPVIFSEEIAAIIRGQED